MSYFFPTKDKMILCFCVVLTILLCLSHRYSSVEIRPELQKNILKFGYGISYKYEGMLAHSFDRFYVVTKFILPTLEDLILSPISYDKECNYIWDLDDQDNKQIKQNIKDLLLYCNKLRQFMAFYKMQIKACNATAHHILKNEVDLILLKFYMEQRYKRGVFGTIISGFIGLAFEGISSFLHHKRHKALHKAVKAMSILMDVQRNKWMHLENTLVMYRIYNAKTLQKLVKTVTHSWQSLKVYSQANQHQPMKHIHKCMEHTVSNIMWLILCYIYVLLKTNISKFIMNLSCNYEYMLRQLEYWLKIICPFHL